MPLVSERLSDRLAGRLIAQIESSMFGPVTGCLPSSSWPPPTAFHAR